MLSFSLFGFTVLPKLFGTSALKTVFSTVLSMLLQLNTVFRGAECHVSQEMSGGMQQLVWELRFDSNFSFWLRELVCRDRR